MSLKITPFDRSHTSCYSSVYTAVGLSYGLYRNRPSIAITFDYGRKTIMVWLVGYPTMQQKFNNVFSRFDTLPSCARLTGGQTSCHRIVSAILTATLHRPTYCLLGLFMFSLLLAWRSAAMPVLLSRVSMYTDAR